MKLPSQSSLTLRTKAGDQVDFCNVKKVWWRRPQPVSPLPLTSPNYVQYVEDEYLAFWQSFIASLSDNREVIWYNPYKANETADRKFRQLQIAAELGVVVPKTLVTNVVDEALAFIDSVDGEVIFKSFAGNDQFWQPTRRYRAEYRQLLEDHLGYCPIILQEFVSGPSDYRIVCIDGEAFAVEFDIASSRYQFDVRIDTLNRAREVAVEQSLADKLRMFMQRTNIRYGAFDFRRRHDGTMVFFEVNPAGQFLYLDRIAGTSIARAMARALSVDDKGTAAALSEDFAGFRPGQPVPFAGVVPDQVVHLLAAAVP